MGAGKSLLVAVAALTVGAGSALAEGIAGRWSLSFQGGTELELSGNLHEAGSGRVLNLPTSVEARSFGDIYSPSFRGQVSLGYGIGPRSELLLRGSYYKMTADTLQVGTVAGLTLNADFADYKEVGIEAGYRYHFEVERKFRPYVGLSAGLGFRSELPATFSVPAAGVVLPDVPFFDKSTVGVFAGQVGFDLQLDERVALGLETGPRYETKPSPIDGLAGTGLEPINDTASRWSMPVVVGLKVRF